MYLEYTIEQLSEKLGAKTIELEGLESRRRELIMNIHELRQAIKRKVREVEEQSNEK